MKIAKIVDTIETYGAAEEFLNLDSDFSRFLKAKYGRSDVLKTNAKEIVKKYHLKGIVFGNYVTQEERYHFLYIISKQLEVLAKIKGSNNLGENILIIAFGSQGHSGALAHYNPLDQLINLNRGRKGDYKNTLQGEDSFIHEYGHFLDYMQGSNDKKNIIKTPNDYFASNNPENAITGSPKTKAFAQVVNEIEADESYIKKLNQRKNSKYLKQRIEIFARIFESALTYYIVDKWKSKEAFFNVKKYNSDIYLSKETILKNGYENDIVNILQGKGITKKVVTSKVGTKPSITKRKKQTKSNIVGYMLLDNISGEIVSTKKTLQELKKVYKSTMKEDLFGEMEVLVYQIVKKGNKNQKGKKINVDWKKVKNEESYFINYLNKENNFKETTKTFTDYNKAVKWGKTNLDNFNLDMIKTK